MVILGLSYGHADSSATLLVDGIVVGAIAEERLGIREKHDPSFPIKAVEMLLQTYGINLFQVDFIAVARNPQANFDAKCRYALSSLSNFRNAFRVFRAKSVGDRYFVLSKELSVDIDWLRPRVVWVEHHLAHIASAYFSADTEEPTLGYSYDGSGDFVSQMIAQCEGRHIRILERRFLPNSLGFFYTAMCQLIGFDRFGEEYKVMGLASYGENEYSEAMQRVLHLDSLGRFVSPAEFYTMHSDKAEFSSGDDGIGIHRMYTSRLAQVVLGSRKIDGLDFQTQANIAKSTQVRFEQAALSSIGYGKSLFDSRYLAIAGGCALNGVANSHIARSMGFDHVFHHPASSDDGTSLGAALWAWHSKCNGKKVWYMSSPYLGGEYSNVNEVIRSKKYVSYEFSEPKLLIIVASLIKQGLVVGWFQGRSEWGPRALGNRSILADPSNPNMKEIINAKIKRRESFRPFAPSVLAADIGLYFENPQQSPFMMHVLPWKKEWRERFPSVVHVDGTGRLQTVSKETNRKFYALLEQMKLISGHGILLNTSFNENEPVVETPQQALACFERTDMDVCVINNVVVMKNPTLLDSSGC